VVSGQWSVVSGHLKRVNTPVCSPQSNSMAESFVNTFKRDYVSRMDLVDARTVIAQMASALDIEDEITQGVPAASRCPTASCSDRADATLRIARILKYGGKITGSLTFNGIALASRLLTND
jgi:hypothetical protein